MKLKIDLYETSFEDKIRLMNSDHMRIFLMELNLYGKDVSNYLDDFLRETKLDVVSVVSGTEGTGDFKIAG